MLTPTLRSAATAAVLVLTAGCATAPQYYERSRGSGDATSVQALIGAALYDDGMTFESTDPNDPDNKAVADVSQMPLLGVAGQYRLTGDRDFEAGLDGSLLFSWWKDSSSVTAIGGGTVIISVSMRMFFTDIAFGGYVAKVINDSIRIYAAAGPLLLFANGSYSDEKGGSTENGFGVGGYLRAGAEFRIDRQSFLGFGVRGVASTIDFGGQFEDVDADGVQLMLTFTQQF